MKKLVLPFLIYLFLFIHAPLVHADPEEGGWVVVPFPIYTPETDLAMTLSALRHFRLHRDAQVSSILVSGAYSLNRQANIRMTPEISLREGKSWFEGEFAFEHWPDEFYGVGHNTPESDREDYTSRIRTVSATHLRQVRAKASLGLAAEYRRYDIVEREDGGMLASASVLGGDGAEVAGGGLVAVLDRRDDRFAPQSGVYGRVSALAYYDRIHAHRFEKLVLDARQYVSLNAWGVLAAQQHVTILSGRVPFQELARIGDIREISLMRGYYSGRYLDKQAGILQGEWRYPIAWRLSGTLFGGIGLIGSDVSRKSTSSVHGSAGAGLRFRASGTERINLRLDAAMGKGSSGVYFGLMEAF